MSINTTTQLRQSHVISQIEKYIPVYQLEKSHANRKKQDIVVIHKFLLRIEVRDRGRKSFCLRRSLMVLFSYSGDACRMFKTFLMPKLWNKNGFFVWKVTESQPRYYQRFKKYIYSCATEKRQVRLKTDSSRFIIFSHIL